jgi:hypothetical protein
MSIVEPLFVALSAALSLVCLVLVGAAVHAYVETEREVMVHLSLGFTLIVAATVATSLSALLNDFDNARSLLLVNNGFSMAGYLFVVYSVISYE